MTDIGLKVACRVYSNIASQGEPKELLRPGPGLTKPGLFSIDNPISLKHHLVGQTSTGIGVRLDQLLISVEDTTSSRFEPL